MRIYLRGWGNKGGNDADGKKTEEQYALFVLKNCVDSRLIADEKHKGESPDWQFDELDLGIEITKALSKEQGKRQHFAATFLDLETPEEKDAYLRRKPSIAEKTVDGHYFTYQDFRGDYECANIYHAIERKTKLLQQGFKRYGDNWLFVFSDLPMLNEEDLKDVCDRWKDSPVEGFQFHKVFLCESNQLYVLKEMKDIDRIEIPTQIICKGKLLFQN
ncbi:MAG: hypothetical protein E7486_02710 [Ruminococcaceae bacterium]|nr:hypothetical protein [Oscillospiraceae bacterium]